MEIVPKKGKFYPAFFVKRFRKFPNDYRKRLSELRRMGYVESLQMEDVGGCRVKAWSVIKK